MPPDRRRRRFRRPGTGRWLTETLPSLRIELAPQVRATLTAWMRLYGEANDVRGLATGPIETRFARLRENTAADTLIVWTTPGRWAGGEGLSLRFPRLHLEFVCTLSDGHLVANKVAQVPEDARPPDREPGAVGVVVHAERVPLPPEDADILEPDVGVDTLEEHFARLAGQRWGGFAAPLRAALEAEAREDEARTQRLTVAFKDAAMTRGGEEDVWRLKGVPIEALRALDDGEWLEVLDEQGRSRTSARVIDTHPSAGTVVVGVRTASDPPRAGFIRPRSRRKILEQKRALLEELASPTGSLPNLVRLVAAPASMPTPRQERPPRFVNPAVLRNRSQSRAVSLALGLEEGEALLIQGPPGTGKSTTAAEIDVQLILRDPGVRILVCSHSNHGTDNMLMKVLPFLDDAAERIARIGFYERIAREARPFYAAPDADLGDRNIIFTTIDALVLQDVAGARVYDYVLVDEANRAGVLDSLLALARGKRMIMVGDPMQLQPVMSEAEQQMVAAASNGNGADGANGLGGGGRRGRGDRNRPMVGVAQPGANNVIGKSLFAWIQERRFAPAAAVLLDQQNRMHPAIGELVSRVFYGNRVRTGPAAPRRGTGLPAFPSPVSWVDTRSLRGNVESRAGGTSLFNVAEARLVTSITRHLASHAPPNLTIGVITAYAEQRDLLRRLMGPHDWPPDRQLEIDTVDAFEGREKDIIVLSLVRANRRRDIGFLRLEQRLNVAVSRSRRLIIIVGDTSTLRGGYFNHLVATCQSVGQIIPAPKLIGQFLSRVGARRPRRERDERRRDGPLELPVGADEGMAADEAADGEAAPMREGVAPVAAPGQEGPGAGSRRRRRRAWERRRERLRQMYEQPPSDQPSDEQGEAAASEPALSEPGATPRQPDAAQRGVPEGEEPPIRRLRRRRRLGAPREDRPADTTPAVASVEAAGQLASADAAPAEVVPPRTRRPRRTRAQPEVIATEPAAPPTASAPPPSVPAASPPEPAEAPVRASGRRKKPAPGEPITAEAPEPVAAAEPAPPQTEPASAPSPGRATSRRKKAAPIEPLPVPAPIVEAPTPVVELPTIDAAAEPPKRPVARSRKQPPIAQPAPIDQPTAIEQPAPNGTAPSVRSPRTRSTKPPAKKAAATNPTAASKNGSSASLPLPDFDAPGDSTVPARRPRTRRPADSKNGTALRPTVTPASNLSPEPPDESIPPKPRTRKPAAKR